jgi:hypothetical protein
MMFFFGDKTSTYSYFFSFLTTLIGRKIRHYQSVYFVFDQLTSVTPSIVVIKISFILLRFFKNSTSDLKIFINHHC